MATEAALAPTPVAVPPMVAEAVLAPPPVAEDAAENVLAPMPIAAPPVAADDDAGAVDAAALPPVAAPPVAAADALVPTLLADPPVTADDSDADFVTRTLASPPPEQKSAYVTNAQEEVPSQTEIGKVNEYINGMLIPTLHKSCGMVIDMKENETNHFSLALPSINDSESNHGAICKQPEETDHSLDHSVSGDQQPMADFDEDVHKSRSQQPVPCPSDQQQNPTLGYERNDQSQDVSQTESDEKLTPLEIRYMVQRGLMDPRRMLMRNQYGVDACVMGSRFCSNRDNGYDQCCYSDESDQTHEGEAWRFDHRFDYLDAHHQMCHGRGRRIECPCHCKDGRYHRNSGRPCWPGSDPYNPMDVDDLSDHSLSDENDHIDDDDASLYVTFYQRDHHRIFRERSACPCHCSRRRHHRNYGYSCQNSSYPYNPMAIARERWSPSKPDREHMGRWFSPKLDLEKEKYNVGAALLNPEKWTCFLNCILQCMVHTVPLVLKLQEADHPDPCPRASIGFCCYCSLKLHINESIRCSGSSFFPMRFVDRLSAISPDFEWGIQQDAQELLRCLLDKLDDTSVAPRSSEEPPPSTEGGIAKDVFGGRLKSQLHCPECNRCSDRSEAFLDLSLEVNMVETLTDALESFTKVEVIEDVMCDGCKSRVNMEKHLKIEQAPEVLVIHLKRFLHSGRDISKIWDKVKYTLELNIEPFMCSMDDAPQKYDLYGVVEHWGFYGRGHYVCFIRSSQTNWYKFDDHSVYRCSEEEVLDKTSYLLFYVKQGSSPWFSSLLEKMKMVPPDGLAERDPDELKDKEELTCSDGQDGLGKQAVDGIEPSLVRDANGGTLLDEPERLGCSLEGISGETQDLSCGTGSGGKNEHVDNLTESLETKEDGSPRGSLLDRKEMKGSTGDNRGTHGCSVVKNDNTFSLLGRTLPEPSTNSSLHDDQKVACSGAPSDFWICSSEKKAIAESSDSDNDEEQKIGNNDIRKGKCKQLSSSAGEGGGGKKRKQRKARSTDEFRALRRHKRKKRAAARPLHPFGRWPWSFSVKSKKRRQ